MKWIHNSEDGWQWEAWTLIDPDHPKANRRGEVLFAVDYQYGGVHAWTVRSAEHPGSLGVIPFDTPEEELKALAIAMWRLG